VCRSWVDYSFEGDSRQRLVNQVLGNLVHLHHLGVVTLPRNGRQELTITWDHYRFASDGDYGTIQEAVSYDFWVSIFSMHDFFHCPSVLIHFLLHILFCNYASDCPRRATTRRMDLRSSTTQGHEGCSFLWSHSGEQYVLQGRPCLENEQEAWFFINLLDRGAI
jgi:hypothetical protein